MTLSTTVYGLLRTQTHPTKASLDMLTLTPACDDQYDSNLDTCACVAHSKRGIGLPLVYEKMCCLGMKQRPG